MIPRTLADETAGAVIETSNDTVDCTASQHVTVLVKEPTGCVVQAIALFGKSCRLLLTLRAGPASAVHKGEQHGVKLVSPVPFPKPRTTSHLSNSLKVSVVRGCEESTTIRTQA